MEIGRSKPMTKQFKEVLERLKNMSEVEKLKITLDIVSMENVRLREELKYKQMNDYVTWWNSIKDKPII